MALPVLPSELWAFVVDQLWRADLRACLFVSRRLRELALARLFRAVHLHFGVRGAQDALQAAWVSDESRDDWLEFEAAQTRRAGELLDAIARDRVFARAVKKIVVHAAHARHECVMERMMLVRALVALPHLLEFVWIGRSPYFQQDVVDALAQSCRRLRRLHIDEEAHTLSRHGCLPEVDFANLIGLSHISCFAQEMYAPSPGSIAYEDCFEALVDANDNSLRELETEAMWIGQVPERIFGHLLHLEIDRVGDEDLPLLLLQASQLESLVLRDTSPGDVLDVLKGTRGHLPHLRSLALLPQDLGEEFTDEHADVFAAFLKETPYLRRLNLLVHFQENAESSLCRLLEGIKTQCRQLETFGFHLGEDSPFCEEALAILARVLPLSLGAVSLSLPWDPSDTTTPLLDELAKLTGLRFLHFGWGVKRVLHFLSAEELAQNIPSLKVIILGDGTPSAWDVDRPLEPGGKAKLARWTRRRLEYRGIEDFMPDTEDGEWLVRYTIGQSFEAVPY